jgi:hypothetical protein
VMNSKTFFFFVFLTLITAFIAATAGMEDIATEFATSTVKVTNRVSVRFLRSCVLASYGTKTTRRYRICPRRLESERLVLLERCSCGGCCTCVAFIVLTI